MRDFVTDVVNAGVVMFVVGALLGLAAGPLAGALGPQGLGLVSTAVVSEATKTSPMWLGAFFSAFGAINAAVAPALGAIFRDKNAAKANEHEKESAEKIRSPLVVINVQQDKQHEVAQTSTKHCGCLEAERAQAERTVGRQ